MDYFLGIDVGTGSARVGLFDKTGSLIAHAVEPIKTWKPQPNFVEQSSEDIWSCICKCTQAILKKSELSPDLIKGIGFDATCSLVLVDKEGAPISVDPEGEDQKNIIVWMDHRALEQTHFINSFKDQFDLFKFVGGQISPEMQMPKLLWLKKHLSESWARAEYCFDLPDYLTFRATGSAARSLCSLTCKWTYNKNTDTGTGWDLEFLKAIGLEDLALNNFKRIGPNASQIGSRIGEGLSESAAQEMGLKQGTPVGVSIIDAHAGGIGMIGLSEEDEGKGLDKSQGSVDLDKRLALIGGTSSCHMAVSQEARFISGVWGPYDSAMVPGLWLNEGGQSATGALVDHVINTHGAYSEAQLNAQEKNVSIYEYLNQILEDLSGGGSGLDQLTQSLHVCPYFHGNRSPRANPELTGMISGLKLSASLNDLALLYLATIQAIAYGTRHIIEAMNEKGYAIDTLICCGGGTKNPIFLQQHANITGCRLILPKESESVLLGSAMLGAVASESYADLQEAMRAMSHKGSSIEVEPSVQAYHDKKYQIFHKLYTDQIEYDKIMKA